MRRLAGGKIRYQLREVVFAELNPARRAGGYQRQHSASSDSVDKLCALFHDGKVGTCVGIENLVEAQHPQSRNHLTGYIRSDRISEFLSQSCSDSRSRLNNYIFILVVKSIPYGVDISVLLQRSRRAYVDALTAAYAYGVVKSSVSRCSYNRVEASVYSGNRPHCLYVVADADAPSAEHAAVRVSLN